MDKDCTWLQHKAWAKSAWARHRVTSDKNAQQGFITHRVPNCTTSQLLFAAITVPAAFGRSVDSSRVPQDKDVRLCWQSDTPSIWPTRSVGSTSFELIPKQPGHACENGCFGHTDQIEQDLLHLKAMVVLAGWVSTPPRDRHRTVYLDGFVAHLCPRTQTCARRWQGTSINVSCHRCGASVKQDLHQPVRNQQPCSRKQGRRHPACPPTGWTQPPTVELLKTHAAAAAASGNSEHRWATLPSELRSCDISSAMRRRVYCFAQTRMHRVMRVRTASFINKRVSDA